MNSPSISGSIRDSYALGKRKDPVDRNSVRLRLNTRYATSANCHSEQAAAPTPMPPTATPTPAPAAERIRFAPGATLATVEGNLPANAIQRHVMHVAVDQYVAMDATALVNKRCVGGELPTVCC